MQASHVGHTVDSIGVADDNALQNELVAAQRQQVQQHLPVSIDVGVGDDDSKVSDSDVEQQLQLEHHLAQLHEQHNQLIQQAQAEQVLELQRAQQMVLEQQVARQAEQMGVDSTLQAHLAAIQSNHEVTADDLSAHEQQQQLLLAHQQQLEAQIQQAALAQHHHLAQQQLLAEGLPMNQPGLTEGPSRYVNSFSIS